MPMEADASPLPSDETTPPVTKMNFVRLLGVLAVGMRVCLLSWSVDENGCSASAGTSSERMTSGPMTTMTRTPHPPATS